jgi:serine protease Do
MKTFPLLAIPVILISYCITAVSAAEPRSNWATDAYKKNCDSVVFIQGDKVEDSAARTERAFNGMGTGIIIDERGYIITNYHVVKDIRKIQVTTYDQKQYTASLVAKDSDTDLAIIKVNIRSPLRPITFGRSDDLMPGESCIAIGNPYGYAFSLTDGRISAINREVGVNESALIYRLAIQTNTEINPGNSGGPLINVDGEMIGINVAIRQGASGIAFAIPVDQVVEIAAKLIGELVEQQIGHGIKVTQVDVRSNRFAVVVESVESNSPAALAGIQQGDIITGIGKYTLTNKFDFYRSLIGLKKNDEIAVTVQRNRESVDVVIAVDTPKGNMFANRNVLARQAAAAPKTANLVLPKSSGSMTAAALDEMVWKNLGIRYEPMPAEEYERKFPKYLSEYRGGVVVKEVREDGPMAQGQVTIGDVIVGISDWETTSNSDLQYIATKGWSTLQAKSNTVQVNVFRDGQHYYTEVPTK